MWRDPSYLKTRLFLPLGTILAIQETVRYSDLSDFLSRFKKSSSSSLEENVGSQEPQKNLKISVFRTSVSLLPPHGRKMRAYGSMTEFSSGFIFELPATSKQEDQDVIQSSTWVWPSGYSAKTEFNIDDNGNLINGRNEAQVSLSVLKDYNG